MENEEILETIEGKTVLIHPGQRAEDVCFHYLAPDQQELSDPTGRASILIARGDGIGIQGPVSIQTYPDQIRIAGMWKVNPTTTTALPSTLYTPVPWLRQSFPTVNKDIIQGVASISSLLAGLGI